MPRIAGKNRRLRITAMATGILASASMTMFVASPAQAATCPWQVATPEVNGEGFGYVTEDIHLRVGGPYSACPNGAPMSEGETFYLHCYMYNNYSNLWWYGRRAGTSSMGWVSNDVFHVTDTDDNDDGIDAIVRCF